jgi:hypothetical protein
MWRRVAFRSLKPVVWPPAAGKATRFQENDMVLPRKI